MTNDIAFLIIYILSLLLACCSVFDSNFLALKIVKFYTLRVSSNFERVVADDRQLSHSMISV